MANIHQYHTQMPVIGYGGIKFFNGNGEPFPGDGGEYDITKTSRVVRGDEIPYTFEVGRERNTPLGDHIIRAIANAGEAWTPATILNGGVHDYVVDFFPKDTEKFAATDHVQTFSVSLVFRTFGQLKSLNFDVPYFTKNQNDKHAMRLKLVEPLLRQNKYGWHLMERGDTYTALASKDLSCVISVRWDTCRNIRFFSSFPEVGDTDRTAYEVLDLKLTPTVFRLKNFIEKHLTTQRRFPAIPEVGRVWVPGDQTLLPKMPELTKKRYGGGVFAYDDYRLPKVGEKYFYALKKGTRQNLYRIGYTNVGDTLQVASTFELCSGRIDDLAPTGTHHHRMAKLTEAVMVLSMRNQFQQAKKVLPETVLRMLANYTKTNERALRKDQDKLEFFFQKTEWHKLLMKRAPKIDWLNKNGFNTYFEGNNLVIAKEHTVQWYNHTLRLTYNKPFKTYLKFRDFLITPEYNFRQFSFETSRKICSQHSGAGGDFCTGGYGNEAIELLIDALKEEDVNGVMAGIVSIMANTNSHSLRDRGTDKLAKLVKTELKEVAFKEQESGAITVLPHAPNEYTMTSWEKYFDLTQSKSKGLELSYKPSYEELLGCLVLEKQPKPVKLDYPLTDGEVVELDEMLDALRYTATDAEAAPPVENNFVFPTPVGLRRLRDQEMADREIARRAYEATLIERFQRDVDNGHVHIHAQPTRMTDGDFYLHGQPMATDATPPQIAYHPNDAFFNEQYTTMADAAAAMRTLPPHIANETTVTVLPIGVAVLTYNPTTPLPAPLPAENVPF